MAVRNPIMNIALRGIFRVKGAVRFGTFKSIDFKKN